MSELRERLREAADAAAREGRTPTAAAVVARGRRRRRRLAGGTAAVGVLALVAVTVATDRRAPGSRCRWPRPPRPGRR